ncbi:alkene reductase [Williamsia sp. CHRR-6]|uniref:alkene reductase n=1 Tax=Williamsia sp. CHRR-6 TaxID=2835871 RepID=UPI001BD95EE3|nr:alkene reductase [Williamsia sp. CHRR-6]MBT0568260.1 alkene reductase [Williamsia sp. CHRR-6]
MVYQLTSESALLTPVTVGATAAANRIFMAPLTRQRAQADGTPSDLQVEHYRQRAGAGLIITEATHVSATAGGAYLNTPGIHTDRHQQRWAEVAEAVHGEGGKIFVQIWHVGRVAHPLIPGGEHPVAPSAIAAEGSAHTPEGSKPLVTPRALETDEIAGIVDSFRTAARRAVDAGLDGVEIHAANGYLLHEFLGDDSNQRTDAYGGSPANRARIVVETVQAVVDEIGADRVGIRLSPGHQANGMNEADPVTVYQELLRTLADIPLAYVHLLIEPDDPTLATLRSEITSPVVINTGFVIESDFAQLESLVANGTADAVSVGRWFISNPDLVERLRTGVELTAPDQSTFYSPGAKGYTDYPTLVGQSA